MKSRWLLNLALAALVLALAVLAYFRPAPDKPPGPPLTTLSADTVTRIRLEHGNRATVLEKTGDAWRMTAPVRARANRFNIDSALRIANVNSSFQIAADTATLATYGLDKPLLRLQLNDEIIDVGAPHPMHQQQYVRYRDAVHLIPHYVLVSTFQPYTAFLDTQLLETGRKLTALRLPDLQLTKKDGIWRHEPAGKKRDASLSMDRLNGLVAEWENARALSVEKLSTKPALAQVLLGFEEDGKAATLKLDILAYKPEFVLARRDEGLEYHFPEEIGKRLLTLAAE